MGLHLFLGVTGLTKILKTCFKPVSQKTGEGSSSVITWNCEIRPESPDCGSSNLVLEHWFSHTTHKARGLLSDESNSTLSKKDHKDKATKCDFNYYYCYYFIYCPREKKNSRYTSHLYYSKSTIKPFDQKGDTRTPKLLTCLDSHHDGAPAS